MCVCVCVLRVHPCVNLQLYWPWFFCGVKVTSRFLILSRCNILFTNKHRLSNSWNYHNTSYHSILKNIWYTDKNEKHIWRFWWYVTGWQDLLGYNKLQVTIATAIKLHPLLPIGSIWWNYHNHELIFNQSLKKQMTVVIFPPLMNNLVIS